MLLIAAGMALVGSLCLLFAGRIPGRGSHALIAGSVGVTGLLMFESGAAVGQYGTIFVWATLISAYFFSLRIAAVALRLAAGGQRGDAAVGGKHRRLLAAHPLALHLHLARRW